MSEVTKSEKKKAYKGFTTNIIKMINKLFPMYGWLRETNGS